MANAPISENSPASAATVTILSAITLVTRAMGPAVHFYEALGFTLVYGGATSDFSSLKSGTCFVNLTAREAPPANAPALGFWGRVIFYVDDVDGMYNRAVEAGYRTEFAPRDATWGERYFHIVDLDGHELSFAKPLSAK